ncbi:hypothetical protein [Herbidospora daliensis]|uniref:hypothetical protein n=1 Tax=Herbidospora daliensis TaxID=295585 RepID=UPI000784A2C2|nr:hypothetical protein [Herbidospora daliensis]
MSRSSWIYLTLAFVVSVGELVYLILARDEVYSFAHIGPMEPCPGNDLTHAVSAAIWSGVAGSGFPDTVFTSLLTHQAPIAVVISVIVLVVATMGGRRRLGRASVRALALAVLVTGGYTPAFALYDLVAAPHCLGVWGGPEGMWMIIVPSGPSAVATSLLMLLAARPARGEARTAGRILAGLAAVTLVLAVVQTDLSQAGAERVTCDEFQESAWTPAEVFLCEMRRENRFTGIADRDVLAHGRAACARYPVEEFSVHDLAPICPAARRQVEAVKAAQVASGAAADAANRIFCDGRRHQPKIRARHVVRDVIWPDYGVIESLEGDYYEDGLVERSLDTGIATSRGHLVLNTHSDFENCVQVEVYTKRPPKEPTGWDRVVEVGYTSPTGRMVLGDTMSAAEGLTVPGLRPGRHRIRFHYAKPDERRRTPQVVLLMIWPEP